MKIQVQQKRVLYLNTFMSKLSYRYLIYFFAISGLIACETSLTGSLNENKAPRTNLTINEVNRSGDDRLSSQISVSWWGDDPDGYVVGYEYTFNNDTAATSWRYTTKTDSIFILPIEFGKDTSDVIFRIRAVDNLELRDPSGASVVFPIKNSAPTIRFITAEIPPDTSYSIFSFGWSAFDLDGQTNINKVEFAINTRSTWIDLGNTEEFATLDLVDQNQATTNANVYFGKNFRNTGIQFSGFNTNASNTVYIRVTDNAGAVSQVDSVSWYIKRQKSRILVLNDYQADNSTTILNFHTTLLDSVGLSNFDLMTINDGTSSAFARVPRSAAFPRVTEPTLVKMLAKWDFIYYISSNYERNLIYMQEMTSEFFENGGKMFINVQAKNLSSSDPIFSFLPNVSTTPLPSGVNATGFIINSGTLTESTENPSLPKLRLSQTRSAIPPIEPAAGSISLLKLDFFYRRQSGFISSTVDFTGNEAICLKNAEGNKIHLSMNLNDFTGKLSEFIQYVCIDELGFSSN